MPSLNIGISASSEVPLPIVATTGTASVTQTSFTINGTVNANGASTSVRFRYGTDPTLSSFTEVNATPSTATGTSLTNVSVALSGLTANVTYYYRLVGTSTHGTSMTAIASQATLAYPSVSGGTLTSDATYYYRTFTSSGTLTITDGPLTVDLYLVGRGGTGGAGGRGRVQTSSTQYSYYSNGGGGGAGGRVIVDNDAVLDNGSYTITVGSTNTVVLGAVTLYSAANGNNGSSGSGTNTTAGGGGNGGLSGGRTVDGVTTTTNPGFASGPSGGGGAGSGGNGSGGSAGAGFNVPSSTGNDAWGRGGTAAGGTIRSAQPLGNFWAITVPFQPSTPTTPGWGGNGGGVSSSAGAISVGGFGANGAFRIRYLRSAVGG